MAASGLPTMLLRPTITTPCFAAVTMLWRRKFQVIPAGWLSGSRGVLTDWRPLIDGVEAVDVLLRVRLTRLRPAHRYGVAGSCTMNPSTSGSLFSLSISGHQNAGSRGWSGVLSRRMSVEVNPHSSQASLLWVRMSRCLRHDLQEWRQGVALCLRLSTLHLPCAISALICAAWLFRR